MYHFCKEYGWTIKEFYDQPYYDIKALGVIMEEVHKHRVSEQNKNNAKVRQSSSKPGRRR